MPSKAPNVRLEIRTDRLTLVPIREADASWFHALNIEPSVRKHLWDDEKLSAEAAVDLTRKIEAMFVREQCGLWKAMNGDCAVGYYGLWHFFGERQPQLLYVTDPSHSEQGFAFEASSAVMRYAFEDLGFAYLDAAVDEANRSSRRLAERLGFRFQRHEDMDGKPTLFFRATNPAVATSE